MQEALSRDINKYEIDVCCIQNTKVTENIDQGRKDGNRDESLISKKWKDSVHTYCRISDRICSLQLLNRKIKS